MGSLAILLLFAIVAHISHARAYRNSGPIPPLQLITSPQSCISDVECLLDRYCKAPPPDDAPFLFRGALEASTCTQRLAEGSNCTSVGTTECEDGTFCGFADDFNPTPLRCLRQSPLGASCALTASDPCQGDLVCEFEPKCRPFTFGFEGDFCRFDRQCQQQRGFYCRSNFGQCTAKRPPGAECGVEPENFQCDGFCVGSGGLDKPGVCQRRQRAGERCNDNFRQCQTISPPFRTPRTVDLLCNQPTGSIGTCVLETDLIKQLGAPCNPKNDACDARRGLSCALVRRQYKCVQRATSPDSFQHFCTPNSTLSFCPPDSRGNPRECRRALSRAKKFQGMFACRTRRQIIPLGKPCSVQEFAICAPGAVCEEASGVRRIMGRFAPPPLRTCMMILPDGAACLDQFRFKCKEGSFCVNGTCQPSETPPSVPVTFATVNGDCSQLLCPPGTVCFSNPGVPQSSKFCRLPVLEMGLWQPCFQTARFQLECKENLQCSRNFLGRGLRVCRPKRGVGGICENDGSCAGDLKCDPSFRTEPFQRRCFNSSLSLNIGDSCNPYPRPDEPRCVSQEVRDPINQFITNVFPLLCMPKNGSHICQRPVGLFAQCSVENNVVCQTQDLVCNEFNVCVPASQV